MKFKLLILPIFLILLCGLSISAAAEPVISVTKSKAIVTDAPADSDLLVALYKDGRLLETQVYQGTETIQADYAADMQQSLKSADTVKAFLWNIASLTPIIPCFSSTIDELPEASEKPERVLVLYFSCTGNTEALAEKSMLYPAEILQKSCRQSLIQART